MKWYWLLLIGTVCCAGDRPAHYPPPAKHPLVEAAHKAAKEKEPFYRLLEETKYKKVTHSSLANSPAS